MTVRRPLFSFALALAGVLPAIAFACNSSNGSLLGGPPGEQGGDGGGVIDDSSTPVQVGIDVPISLIVDSAKPDTFVPFNSVDASDRPEGGLPVMQGVITCGSVAGCDVFASTQCCVGEDAGICQAATVKCPADTLSVTCNELADCKVGSACCGTVARLDDAGDVSLGAACAATCALPVNVQLCRTNEECPDGGPCVIQTCSDGNTYELCGAFTAPEDAGVAFSCTPN